MLGDSQPTRFSPAEQIKHHLKGKGITPLKKTPLKKNYRPKELGNNNLINERLASLNEQAREYLHEN